MRFNTFGIAASSILLAAASAFALPKATEIFPKMGLGYNIGNTMEVPKNPTDWGNPFPDAAYVKAIKDAGFTTVRIPCAWDSHASNGTINAGDVFTLMLKFPEGNELAENYWRLRVRSGEAHITENTPFSSTTKVGDWYMITATVPEGIENGKGLYLQVYGADEANWPIGSVMIIKALAINGQEIEIDAQDYGTASTHKGAYEKICPNGAVIAP